MADRALTLAKIERLRCPPSIDVPSSSSNIILEPPEGTGVKYYAEVMGVYDTVKKAVAANRDGLLF